LIEGDTLPAHGLHKTAQEYDLLTATGATIAALRDVIAGNRLFYLRRRW
jgi:hypothetical protein